MQGLDLIHKVDSLIKWGDEVDKQLKHLETTLARLQAEIQRLYALKK